MALNIIFIPKYNAFGAAMATLIAEFIVFFIQFILSFKILADRKVFLSIIPFYCFGIIMMIALYFIKLPDLSNFVVILIKVAVGAVIYLGLAFAYYFLFIRKIYFDKKGSA